MRRGHRRASPRVTVTDALAARAHFGQSLFPDRIKRSDVRRVVTRGPPGPWHDFTVRGQ